MAPCFASLRATARPSVSFTATRRPAGPAFRCAPSFPSGRVAAPRIVVRAEPEAKEEQKEEKTEKTDFNVPHTGRAAPMSEDKRAAFPEQMAAPEGDRAIAGQAWQPTGDKATSETPEDRYGSAEAAAEAMEASKDRSRKSELQTNDDTAQAPGGGMTGEGSSA